MPLRSYSEAEIVLQGRRRLERPLMVLIWLGLVTFSLAEGNGFYLLAGTAAVAVNLVAVHRAQEVYVHRFFVNVGVLIATGILIVEILTVRGELLGRLGHYLILIQICKLFERKANRDYVQMFALSMLLVVASTLVTPAFWLSGLLAAYLALASYTVMVFTLKRKLDQAAVARLVSEANPLKAHRVAWNAVRDWPTRLLVMRTVGGTLFMLVVGCLMFLVAPRQSQSAAVSATSGSAVSGYGQSVTLGDASTRKIYLSDRVAMTVRMEGAQAGGPWARQLNYLRGQTFNHYSRSRWAHSSLRMSSSIQPSAAPALRPEWLQDCVVQEVSQVAAVSSTLLFAAAPVVEASSAQGPARIDGDGEIHFSPAVLFEPMIRYRCLSWPMPLDQARLEYLQALRLRTGSSPEVPPGTLYVSPPVAQLARQWCQDLLDLRQAQPRRADELNLRIAQRLEDKLKGGPYEYTLDLPPVPADRDGVENFLFHARRGHCEYFASALTLMCHSLDIPARLGTGFQLGESAGERSYIVRDRDAHAWTEVFTPSTDWVVFDATPAARRARAGGLWAAMKDQWSAMSFWWYENVVSYDNHVRQTLGKWLWVKIASGWSGIKSVAASARDSLTRLLAHGQVDDFLARLAVGVGALGLGLQGLILFRMFRRSARSRAGRLAGRHAPADLKFLLRLLALLLERGVGAQPAQTARQIAAEAAAKLDLPRPVLDGLMDLYYRLRWGRQSPAPGELAAAEAQVEDLAQRLGKH